MAEQRGKKSRGETTKLSLRLSPDAQEKIQQLASGLGVTRSQVIAFALAEIRKSLPSVSKIAELNARITLSKNHFVLSLTKEISVQLDGESVDRGFKKGVMYGLLVSNYVEQMKIPARLLLDRSKEEQKAYKLYFHKSYASELEKYSMSQYVQLKLPVTMALLVGTENMVQNDFEEYTGTSTTLPVSLIEEVQQKAETLGVADYVYIDSCIRNFLEKQKQA